MILSTPKLLVENENWLLELLYKWYENENKKLQRKTEKTELKREFIKLLQENVIFKKIYGNSLTPNTKKFIQNNTNELIAFSNISNEHVCIDSSMIEDEELQYLLLKYFLNDDEKLISIENEDILILQRYNLQDTLMKLMNTNYIKIICVCILMIIDCGYEVDSININKYFVYSQ